MYVNPQVLIPYAIILSSVVDPDRERIKLEEFPKYFIFVQIY
jgi:hypothetical protein